MDDCNGYGPCNNEDLIEEQAVEIARLTKRCEAADQTIVAFEEVTGGLHAAKLMKQRIENKLRSLDERCKQVSRQARTIEAHDALAVQRDAEIELLRAEIRGLRGDLQRLETWSAFQTERVQVLRAELKTTDDLLDERNRVMEAIPECQSHGNQCVPHAILWIEEYVAKLARMKQLEATIKKLREGELRDRALQGQAELDDMWVTKVENERVGLYNQIEQLEAKIADVYKVCNTEPSDVMPPATAVIAKLDDYSRSIAGLLEDLGEKTQYIEDLQERIEFLTVVEGIPAWPEEEREWSLLADIPKDSRTPVQTKRLWELGRTISWKKDARKQYERAESLRTTIKLLVRREWIGYTGSGGQACPFCHGFYPDHKTDCVRQAAIAEVEGC